MSDTTLCGRRSLQGPQKDSRQNRCPSGRAPPRKFCQRSSSLGNVATSAGSAAEPKHVGGKDVCFFDTSLRQAFRRELLPLRETAALHSLRGAAGPGCYRRSPVMRLAPRRSRNGNIEIWALLHSSMASSARSLVMYSADQGRSWRKVLDYDGTKYRVRCSNAALSPPDHLWLIPCGTEQDSGEPTALPIVEGAPARSGRLASIHVHLRPVLPSCRTHRQP